MQSLFLHILYNTYFAGGQGKIWRDVIAPVIYTVCIIFSLLLAATVGYLLVRKWRGERSEPGREELEMKVKCTFLSLTRYGELWLRLECK